MTHISLEEMLAFLEHELNRLPREGEMWRQRRELLSAIIARLKEFAIAAD
jgi:hypothetical protein